MPELAALTIDVHPDDCVPDRKRVLIFTASVGAGHEATGREIADLLFQTCAERGTTLVLVTHDNALAGRCDRMIRIHSGVVDPRQAKASPLRSAAE